jgi:hypothetical protein
VSRLLIPGILSQRRATFDALAYLAGKYPTFTGLPLEDNCYTDVAMTTLAGANDEVAAIKGTGAGNNLKQATAANRAVLRFDDGLWYLDFGDDDFYLFDNGFTSIRDNTIGQAFLPSSLSNTSPMGQAFLGNFDNGIGLYATNGRARTQARVNGATSAISARDQLTSVDGAVATVSRTGTTSLYIWENGLTASTEASIPDVAPSTANAYLGWLPSAGGGPANAVSRVPFKWYGGGTCQNVMSDEDIDIFGRWLAEQSGATLL